MYNLFLDDIRDPSNMTPSLEIKFKDGIMFHEKKSDNFYKNYDWVVVRTYDEFVDYIKENGLPKLVSFDHDLSPEHYAYMGKRTNFAIKTGYDALIWFCEYIKENNLEIPEIKFHTANYVGKENMNDYLYEFKDRYKKG